ncbi:hypothetical protein QEH52_00585 [Coraliomargarita sp. SDUM461003]|uniref:Prenyltransferase n=1 Tax=Thalassobacterium maritimum TaxID=3041265 RepID=A0ABU1APA7_9BACT|nr:hypothetical protein [Coraliomargarita sp. SDUM461003]MDQ8205990.1 hypothetical protein [Coraliomargarita sp. SDUM461003]
MAGILPRLIHMRSSTKIWQWPNVLAIDAALIAALWLLALERAHSLEITWVAHAVLALSVWLSYVADRLYDVRSRERAALLSTRHDFSKRYARPLWRVWFVALGVDLLLATQLSPQQLTKGVQLLIICLIYTLLNQKLSRRFFPKEICVALIYAGGVQIFLPNTVSTDFYQAFAFLCLLNCLIIGAKEKHIDAKMRVHSLATLVAERWLSPLAWTGAALVLWNRGDLWQGLALSFVLLGLLHRYRAHITIESFRVLVDAALLIGGAFHLILLS